MSLVRSCLSHQALFEKLKRSLRVLTAFTSGFLLITVSELGDKSFFIAALLSMRHSRRVVFAGVMAALVAMTLLSVLLGQVVSLLPKIYLHYGAIILFISFGLKLLYDASRMPAQSKNALREEAAVMVSKHNETRRLSRLASRSSWSPSFTTLLQAFIVTFIAEWGDRTQISTIALTAYNDAVGVAAGAILGHAICSALAVICGRLIAGKISERLVTAIGGVLFLIFGAIELV